jgi:hypothetical protein
LVQNIRPPSLASSQPVVSAARPYSELVSVTLRDHEMVVFAFGPPASAPPLPSVSAPTPTPTSASAPTSTSTSASTSASASASGVAPPPTTQSTGLSSGGGGAGAGAGAGGKAAREVTEEWVYVSPLALVIAQEMQTRVSEWESARKVCVVQRILDATLPSAPASAPASASAAAAASATAAPQPQPQPQPATKPEPVMSCAQQITKNAFCLGLIRCLLLCCVVLHSYICL